ncbi:hypothetical protein [Geobacter sp. SVR]|uniref:hypothetical protein n=1 Tax=Geobacter sp. SVR TaxID=2495594 RepID=UPI00143EF84E|nr:hypothetical protein [Geobacter sp. SVR]BCS53105.1 hypothetical protein GSVR_14130 [Geobacter sp. SVR]GCF84490.1 hypothetical protein GSbR_10900 [Geobacter sp. SVR]
MIRLPLVIAFFLFVVVRPLGAEELTLLGGGMHSFDDRENSYAWQLDYRERFGDRFAASISYLNEGHVSDHHRDGHTLTLWTHTGLFDDRLNLALGAGPYFYFDTIGRSGGSANDHGWGALFSLAATWHAEKDLLVQVRLNGVKTASSIDTVSILAGVGLNLETAPGRSAVQSDDSRPKTARNELTLLFGQTVVNSFDSDKSMAVSLEYRRRLLQYMDGTIGWIYEGDNRLIRRNGVSVQIWGAKDYLDKHVSLGIGAGGYISVDHYYDQNRQQQEGGRSLSGIVTLTAAYLFNPAYALRVSWHRIVTDYDRDTDVLLGGLGYRF